MHPLTLEPLDQINGFSVRPGLYEIKEPWSFPRCELYHPLTRSHFLRAAALSRQRNSTLRNDPISQPLPHRPRLFDDHLWSGY